MQTPAWLFQCVQRWRSARLDGASVQGEATMESLRRYRTIACCVLPLHLAIAWIFSRFSPPTSHPEWARWAELVSLSHWCAAAGVAVSGWWAHWYLVKRQRATGGAVALQIGIAAAYLYFGAHVALLDLRFETGAGSSTFMVICVMFGVLALMRPAITVPLFSATYVIFSYLLENTEVNPNQLLSLRVMAFVAPALALLTSTINWSQYSRAVLLRRQLRRSNEALQLQKQELAYLADHDALTGLFNRREFMRLADMELQRGRRVPAETSVIMLDIDFFKKVNDQFGHPGGDAVLQSTAATLRKALRVTDTLARMGGEEFIVLLPGTGEDGARLVAEKMREAVEDMVTPFEAESIVITASLGVSTLRATDWSDFEALYAAADRALYVAKQTGRNRVEFAVPESSERKPHR
ncbi:GGDEF domain-containing protein [Rhodoferax sp.]|uniref:GGDEF domain-containing protein n=1 Tax=Rhodoferax sp. TaxID=50421 RepID=UPI0026006A18|nr:GGDEF domain-containing protein [Rhodoferax sp.]